jgi:hypothetical protein
VFGLLFFTGLCALTLFLNARAGWPPRIDFIERFLGTNVLIHFDTEPGYFYALQYTETFTNGQPGPGWTNLYVAPKQPFNNHYVVVDTGTRTQRFYRLRVYP